MLTSGKNDWHGEGVRDAAVHVSLPVGDLRKVRVVVKGVNLQKGVLFCKRIFTIKFSRESIENW